MMKEMDQEGLMTVAMVMCFCDRACDLGEKASCRVVVFQRCCGVGRQCLAVIIW